MPKLQRINKSNGSHTFYITIPIEIVEQINWEKGDELKIEVKENRKVEITK